MKSHALVLGLAISGLLIAGCTTPAKPAAPRPAAKPAAPAPATPTPPPAPPAPTVTEPAATTPVSPEAQAVVARLTEPGPDGLKHEVVEATGFPQALASLQTGAASPTVEQPQNYNSQPPTRGLTADGASAELVERDWTGVVLVPVIAQVSKAHTASVRLTSIEAHPLKDGRVRIWTRVRNVTTGPIQVSVACTFAMQNVSGETSPRFYSVSVPVGDYRDVFFVSPAGELSKYTVLVRAGG